MTQTAHLGDRIAVGTSWRPGEQRVGEVAHRWRWERTPTLDNGGYVWRDGLLSINGKRYAVDVSHESDAEGRRWTHCTLTRLETGEAHGVEISPDGQAACVCPHKQRHPQLTCRHEACAPPAVEDFDRELAGRLDRAAGMVDCLEFDF